MNEDVVVAPTGRTWRWWDVLRLALVVLWLLAAVLAWWTAPRKQSYDQAKADVAAGRVTAYQWGDRWDGDDPGPWFGVSALQSAGTLGPLFAWRTPDGQVRWTDTVDFDEVTTTGAVDDKSYSGAGAVGIAQELRAAGLEHRGGDVDSPGPVVAGIGFVLAAIFLGTVVAGPAPVLGTRWFWFWLVSLAPLGLGLLFWLARDRPWSRSAVPAPAVPAPAVPAPAAPAPAAGRAERRDRGILGFAIGVLAAILISILLLTLHGILGDWWVPRPDR